MAARNSEPKPAPWTQAARVQAVQSPVIPVVGELIKSHPGTISLGQGVVYYGPPAEAIEEIKSFLADSENHKYKLVQGIPPLLEAIQTKLASENQITMGRGNALLVTAGGNMAFMNAVLAITDPGDEVILQSPYYFNHDMAIVMAGCKPVFVNTDEQYQLRLDAIRDAITTKTRAVVTVSPNNPTGAVYAESALREVNSLCRRRGLFHIHDEAYEYFVYEGARHFSPGSIPGSADHTISLFSLSKSYGFASWRIGYMVMPRELLVPVKKIQDTILICPPVISQFAAVGALKAGRKYCLAQLEVIGEVRQAFLKQLGALREFCVIPSAQGAFYILVRLHVTADSMEIVERLVREYQVAVIPGTAFGMAQGCFLRIAYGALQKQTAAEGMNRLARGLRALAGEYRPG